MIVPFSTALCEWSIFSTFSPAFGVAIFFLYFSHSESCAVTYYCGLDLHFPDGRSCLCQFSSLVQLCLTLCNPMDCSTPGFPVYPQLPRSLLKLMSIESVMPSSHLILHRPLFLLPSIFPSIRAFSKESVLHVRWPEYWSFSFSISPSNEYSELISFRIY